ncbi:MAG: DUF4339 domain-containing protein, partial [Planctomycetes bacterium]|nr:DUF4339 domain-containing protein [Planctomycetota bacterium]
MGPPPSSRTASPCDRHSRAWHVMLGDQPVGPFALDQIEIMVRTEQVGYTTLMWKEGMGSWQPAAAIPQARDLIERLAPARVPSSHATVPPPPQGTWQGRNPAQFPPSSAPVAGPSSRRGRQAASTVGALPQPRDGERPKFLSLPGRRSPRRGNAKANSPLGDQSPRPP